MAPGTRDVREFPALLNDRDGLLRRTNAAAMMAMAAHDERVKLLRDTTLNLGKP